MNPEIRQVADSLAKHLRARKESVQNVERFVQSWIEMFTEVVKELDDLLQPEGMTGGEVSEVVDSTEKLVHRFILGGETFYMVFQRQLGLPAEGNQEHPVLLAARAQTGREIEHGRIQFYWLSARSGLDKAALWAELHLLEDGRWFGTNLTEWSAHQTVTAVKSRGFSFKCSHAHC